MLSFSTQSHYVMLSRNRHNQSQYTSCPTVIFLTFNDKKKCRLLPAQALRQVTHVTHLRGRGGALQVTRVTDPGAATPQTSDACHSSEGFWWVPPAWVTRVTHATPFSLFSLYFPLMGDTCQPCSPFFSLFSLCFPLMGDTCHTSVGRGGRPKIP